MWFASSELKGLATVQAPYIVKADSEEDAIEEQAQGGGAYYDAQMDWSFDEKRTSDLASPTCFGMVVVEIW